LIRLFFVKIIYLKLQLFSSKKNAYEFHECILVVNFFLKDGEYNSYWEWRKDKADLKGEIGFHDLYSLEDFQMQEKLGKSL